MSVAEFEPKIVAFFCNWCSYAGADLAGTSRIQYPTSVRIIRVPCSGRVNPRFILRAFQMGTDGVLVAGCHPGDCHYATGNFFTRRRLSLVKRFLAFLGIDERRLLVRWISASEGPRFADTVREMTEELRQLGPAQKVAVAHVD